MGGALTGCSPTADPPSVLTRRALVGRGPLRQAAVGEKAMGTVHARVRGPATRGLRVLRAGAAGRRTHGCARGVPWRGGSKGGGARRPAQNRAWRSACSAPALDPLAWCRRPQRRRPRVSETSEQETDTQGRVVTRPRSLSDVVVRKGLVNFPWYPGAEE